MKTTQRTAPAHARTWAHHFEASSVLLFAALTFGAAGARFRVLDNPRRVNDGMEMEALLGSV